MQSKKSNEIRNCGFCKRKGHSMRTCKEAAAFYNPQRRALDGKSRAAGEKDDEK